ncbi:MAG: DUF1150 family protein [Rhodobacteraceae bacterium]|jgi:hypothetical protein|nr:DUF1150 family protein [Paracoccaceae bacterium]
MDVKFEGLPETEQSIVYVRPVPVADLPAEVQAQIGGLTTVYSVNRPDGERLALVADRKLAFALARQHDLAPVNVH